jgi:hypothetical protein
LRFRDQASRSLARADIWPQAAGLITLGSRWDSGAEPAKARKPKKAASGQREMLMAISGKSESKSETKAKGASSLART